MAFWCAQRLAVEVFGSKSRMLRVLEQPYAIIGARAGSDIQLSEAECEARAFYLHATEEGVFCIDLRRDVAAQRRAGRWLKPADKVSAGEFAFRACTENVPAHGPRPAQLLDEDEGSSQPVPELKIFHEGRCLGKRRLGARLTLLGRWPGCGIQLKGQRVSGIHCSFYWRNGRLWCIDLASSNGIVAQTQRDSCVELSVGDRLAIGEFEVVFQRLSYPRLKGPAAIPIQAARQLATPPETSAVVVANPKAARLPAKVDVPKRALSVHREPAILLQLQQKLHEIRAESRLLDQKSAELAAARLEWAVQRAVERELDDLETPVEALPVRLGRGAATQSASPQAQALAHAGSERNSTIVACGQLANERQWAITPDQFPANGGSAKGNELPAWTEKVSAENADLDRIGDWPREVNRISSACAATMTTCPEHTSHCSAEQSEDHSEPVARRGDLAGAQVDSCPTDSSAGTVSVGPSLALDRISELALAKNGSLTGAVAVDSSTRSRRSRRPVNVARDQLVEYVTDRIVKLERKRHRRKFWIGACGALALPAVLASAAGAWLWFGQEYLPMSPAVLQQIPEPIATWLLSIGVMV